MEPLWQILQISIKIICILLCLSPLNVSFIMMLKEALWKQFFLYLNYNSKNFIVPKILKSSTWDPKHILVMWSLHFNILVYFNFSKCHHNKKLVDFTDITHLCIQTHLLCMTICIYVHGELKKRWRSFVYIIPWLRDTTLSSNVFLDYLYFSRFPDYDLHSKLNIVLIFETVTINMHRYAFMMKTYPESYLGLPSFWDKDPSGKCGEEIIMSTWHKSKDLSSAWLSKFIHSLTTQLIEINVSIYDNVLLSFIPAMSLWYHKGLHSFLCIIQKYTDGLNFRCVRSFLMKLILITPVTCVLN